VKLSQVGDKEAMGIILEKFEPMIKSVVSKYYGAWADFEDFVQIGFVGLMQAVFNYDENSNSKFSTFAYLNISSEVKSFVTYLNRQKNKVLTEAISIENTYDDFNEGFEYYLKDPENQTKNLLLNYVIDSALIELNEDETDIVNLWFDGFSYKEISKKLIVKQKKVDNTIQKLKKILQTKKDLYQNLMFFIGGEE
jgi:RNA polymerase sporulation-specific sigma factor